MTYIVNESCINCKLMDCVEVCPVDCFYEGENMLVIHPDECIDCGVCEPECPVEAIKPDTEAEAKKWLKLNADVQEALYPLLLSRGKPEYLRSDNGPEFSSTSFKEWLLRVGIQPIQIYPGSPWENGYNERFNGTLRREVLNAEWFATTTQAQTVIDQWLRQYNHIRPHHALGMRPPVPKTILVNHQITGTDQGG